MILDQNEFINISTLFFRRNMLKWSMIHCKSLELKNAPDPKAALWRLLCSHALLEYVVSSRCFLDIFFGMSLFACLPWDGAYLIFLFFSVIVLHHVFCYFFTCGSKALLTLTVLKRGLRCCSTEPSAEPAASLQPALGADRQCQWMPSFVNEVACAIKSQGIEKFLELFSFFLVHVNGAPGLTRWTDPGRNTW